MPQAHEDHLYRLPWVRINFCNAPLGAQCNRLPRPSLSCAGMQRPARDLQGEMTFFTHAEIALPQPSKIDFRYDACATEPARAPTSVALRSCLLSLQSAHPSQDDRAGPRRWTLQWPLQWRCNFRRAAGPCARCCWSQTLTPGALSASSAVSARPSVGFLALEDAGRSADGHTLGWRHATCVRCGALTMSGDTLRVSCASEALHMCLVYVWNSRVQHSFASWEPQDAHRI